ncbi:hypothetical protein ACS0TY_020761 [Phlomoides rotata]
MGRAPCCDKANVKKGPWSPEEDATLKDFIHKHGIAGNWISLPQKAGLKRCGKSCRLRWLNYLRPNIKHGEFTEEEDTIICNLYATIGSRWSIIAAQLPGRTDNDIKNYWNTKLKKKLLATLQPKSLPPFSFPQSQTLSTLSQLYNSLYYTQSQASKNLAAVNPISTPQNFLYSNTNNYKEEGLMDLQYNYSKDKMLMMGGKEASCSSSDGSCSQISYGGNDQVKREEMGSYQGFMIDHYYTSFDQKMGEQLDHVNYNQLQYDLEEVKDLITADNGNGNGNVCNDNVNLQVYEDKREEDLERSGVMYYY